jgi:hypothetical protein
MKFLYRDLTLPNSVQRDYGSGYLICVPKWLMKAYQKDKIAEHRRRYKALAITFLVSPFPFVV